MKCEIIRDLIPLYCDGICSDETKAAVEEHIAHCENCGKLFQIENSEPEMPSPNELDEK